MSIFVNIRHVHIGVTSLLRLSQDVVHHFRYDSKTYVASDLCTVLSLSLSGVRQALWLTKAKLISGLPPCLLSLAESPANQIPDQDERVQNAIKHARFWDTTEDRPCKEKYR